MKLCKHCGAPNDDHAFNCHYCRIQFLQQPTPPVHQTQPLPPQLTIHHNYYFNQPTASKSGKTTIWKIVGWLFVFPLMITLIALKKKSRNWYIIAAVSWIVYLIIFGPWGNDSDSTSTARVKNVAPVSQEQMIETMMDQMTRSWTPTPAPTETISFTPTAAPSATFALIPTMAVSPTIPAPPELPPPAAVPIGAIPAVAAPAIKNALPVVESTNCHPNYPDVCIPMDQGDINCPDVPFKNFRWINSDPYRLDGNKDGVCCEG